MQGLFLSGRPDQPTSPLPRPLLPWTFLASLVASVLWASAAVGVGRNPNQGEGDTAERERVRHALDPARRQGLIGSCPASSVRLSGVWTEGLDEELLGP